jgi:hypothetical protein
MVADEWHSVLKVNALASLSAGLGPACQARPRRKRKMTRRRAWSSLVVGTGVDPVTFRFSGGRSTN